MQLATPFLISTATVAKRTAKKTNSPSSAPLNQASDQALNNQAVDQNMTSEIHHETATKDGNDSAQQNMGRLLASCCDCV